MKTLIYLMLLFTVLLISAINGSIAQTTHYHYRFSYDNSGNREQRIYVGTALKSATLESGTAFNEEKPIIDSIGFDEIKIYPNPTKGNLIIEIPDMEAEAIRVAFFNLQGKQLMNRNVSSNTRMQLNLSSFPSGMYVVKIVAGQESSEWKIIKD